MHLFANSIKNMHLFSNQNNRSL